MAARPGKTRRLGCGWLLAVLLSGAGGWARPAGASPSRCEAESRRWVAVQFQGQHWSPPLRRLVLAQLAASFDDLELAACAAGARAVAPEASIALRRKVRSRVHVSVAVRSGSTNAQVERDVGVARLNDQGLALAVAVHADELLRASRAALTARLGDARRGQPGAGPGRGSGGPGRPGGSDKKTRGPRTSDRSAAATSGGVASVDAVPAAPASSGAPGRRPTYLGADSTHLGVEGAVDVFGSGEIYLGADAVFSRLIYGPVGLELALGGRGGLGSETAQGTVNSTALALRAGPTLRLLATEPWDLFAVPAVRLLWLQVQGRATDPAFRGRESQGLAVYGQAELVLRRQLMPRLAATLRVGGGVPLRGAAIVAAGERDTAAGASGALLTGGLGVALGF